MNRVAQLDVGDRAILFERTASAMGLSPTLAEKDFWVCWTLKHLFAMPELKDGVVFKGGTTLSKVYGVIARFSEDIDLTLDRELFGISSNLDPAEASGKKERERRLKGMKDACGDYVRDTLRQTLTAEFATVLGVPGEPWSLIPDEADRDGQTLLLRYPAAIETDSSSYVPQQVKLEFGSRGERWPTERRAIRPYAAEQFPDVFREPSTEVQALAAPRTFWEKATILHMEAHRSQDKPMPPRSSRHYYDLAMLAGTSIRRQALADLALLEHVVQHKKDFFRCGWANYEEAKPGTLRLLPADFRLKELRNDYDRMRIMMFDEPPAFQTILDTLAVLEQEINHDRN